MKNYELPEISSIDIAVSEIGRLRGAKVEEFDRKICNEQLHKALSKFLFSAVEKTDCDTIARILSHTTISKRELLDENGYNIIEHLIKYSKNAFFIKLYTEYRDHVNSYFSNVPVLFIATVNNKNYELIKFFLKTSDLSEFLKKQHLANVFFVAIEGGQDDLATYIVENYDSKFDAKEVEATMFYFIANNKNEQFEKIIEYDKFMNKLGDFDVEKLVAYCVLNKNVVALKIIMENQHFMDIISSSDPNMQKTIMNMLSGNLLE
jgi:hypothetical protein